MPKAEIPWRRRQTLEAACALVCWRLAVAFVPMRNWIGRLGSVVEGSHEAEGRFCHHAEASLDQARTLARHIDRAGERLPFAILCLPRALALGTMLRRRGIAHTIVIAARPAQLRGGDDDLHAWASVEGTVVLGDLPGPWNTVLKMHYSG